MTMTALARLAGWTTVPDPGDHTVVRLALTEARARNNPDAGGKPAAWEQIEQIEHAWLDEVL